MSFASKALLLAATLAPAALIPSAHAQTRSNFIIFNESTVRFAHIYFVPEGHAWGDDVIMGLGLNPTQSLKIETRPATYALRIVDQNDHVCSLPHIANGSFKGNELHLDNAMLLTCEVATILGTDKQSSD
jgi:hypothetical protein